MCVCVCVQNSALITSLSENLFHALRFLSFFRLSFFYISNEPRYFEQRALLFQKIERNQNANQNMCNIESFLFPPTNLARNRSR